MLTRISAFAASSIVVTALSGAIFAAQPIHISPDHESGVYSPGERLTWKIVLDPPATGPLRYEVRKGGLEASPPATIELQNGAAEVTATRDDPGTLLLAVTFKPPGAEKETTAYGGAVFAPEKIARSLPPPADFDQFWQSKVDELRAVPMNVQLEPIDLGNPAIEYYKVTMDNIRGTKIYGQLAKPAGKTDLPAALQVQWAGVYPLDREWVLNYARQGWLSFNISAHDLPIDQPAAFYTEKQTHELNDYPGQGADDREASYFLRMFLSCRRAVDFIAARPDWNHKTLLVHGGSQGGYQTIVTAGLCPEVTAMAACVPAGCDHTGKQAGRSPGWPNWASRTWKGMSEAKMLETARYFDAMNFAPRIQCAALVGMGLADTVCPAEGVFATFNEIQGPKQIVIMPQADHGGDHKAYYAALGPFLEAQKSAAKSQPKP